MHYVVVLLLFQLRVELYGNTRDLMLIILQRGGEHSHYFNSTFGDIAWIEIIFLKVFQRLL